MTTQHWRRHLRVGRFQLGATLMRHVYGVNSPDRWVFQTSVVFDRAAASTREGSQ